LVPVGLHIPIGNIPVTSTISTAVTICCACTIIGCESLDKGPYARDRCGDNGIAKLCLGPHNELGLKECRIRSQPGTIEICKAECNCNDQTSLCQ
jgi:hypothetical protein